jgi:molybdopterin molybdotransferase
MNELGLDQALALLCEEIPVLRETEIVPAAQAQRRVLAQPVVSALDLPAFDNAAMDGFAVRAADCTQPTRLHCIGNALAGHAFAGTVGPNEAVRTMTGAPMPAGTDALVMLEDVSVEGDEVSCPRPIPAGLNVRQRGEHVQAGQTVLTTGRHLCAAEIGLAAAVGCAELTVFRRLRVGIASTGDELADPPQPLPESGSYDANRPFLRTICTAAGFDTLDLGICDDTPAAFSGLLHRAATLRIDALLVSGGSAQGDADVVRRAESVRFVPLNIRPGRGVTLGRIERAGHRLALIGLPGNAVAAFVMFQLLALPALLHCAGGVARVPTHLPLPLAVELRCKPGRVEYRRARFIESATGLAVEPLPQQGSAMLKSLADADALIAVGPGTHYPAGAPIPTVPLASLSG